jgi:hypothetical protein
MLLKYIFFAFTLAGNEERYKIVGDFGVAHLSPDMYFTSKRWTWQTT